MDVSLKMLSDEHQNILKAIDAMLEECGALEAGEEINADFFKEAIDFVRGYADRFHHAKEEDILFVELNKAGAAMHCNPTPQMLHEHDLGRNFIKELEEGVATGDKNKVTENARGYAELLQDHIFKEDNILYPMADEALDQKTKTAMLKKFQQIEQERAKEKEKYLSFINDL